MKCTFNKCFLGTWVIGVTSSVQSCLFLYGIVWSDADCGGSPLYTLALWERIVVWLSRWAGSGEAAWSSLDAAALLASFVRHANAVKTPSLLFWCLANICAYVHRTCTRESSSTASYNDPYVMNYLHKQLSDCPLICPRRH